MRFAGGGEAAGESVASGADGGAGCGRWLGR